MKDIYYSICDKTNGMLFKNIRTIDIYNNCSAILDKGIIQNNKNMLNVIRVIQEVLEKIKK